MSENGEDSPAAAAAAASPAPAPSRSPSPEASRGSATPAGASAEPADPSTPAQPKVNLVRDTKLTYPRVYQVIKAHASEGQLKLAPAGFAFKNRNTGKVMQVQKAELTGARWMWAARGYQLRLMRKAGSSITFDGFRSEDKDELFNFFKSAFDIDIKEAGVGVRGFNWGVPVFNGPFLSFLSGEDTVFEIPLQDVSNANGNKSEAMIEFHPARNNAEEERKRKKKKKEGEKDE